jgi:hypothetical protein
LNLGADRRVVARFPAMQIRFDFQLFVAAELDDRRD